MSLLLTEVGSEAQRSCVTCPRPHSKGQSGDLNPGGPVPEFVLSISLPHCLSLPSAPFSLLGWPRVGSGSHPCFPLACESAGTLSRSDWLPRGPSHPVWKQGVSNDGVQKAVSGQIPSVPQGKEGEPAQDSGNSIKFGNKCTLLNIVCVIIMMETTQKMKATSGYVVRVAPGSVVESQHMVLLHRHLL